MWSDSELVAQVQHSIVQPRKIVDVISVDTTLERPVAAANLPGFN